MVHSPNKLYIQQNGQEVSYYLELCLLTERGTCFRLHVKDTKRTTFQNLIHM